MFKYWVLVTGASSLSFIFLILISPEIISSVLFSLGLRFCLINVSKSSIICSHFVSLPRRLSSGSSHTNRYLCIWTNLVFISPFMFSILCNFVNLLIIVSSCLMVAFELGFEVKEENSENALKESHFV